MLATLRRHLELLVEHYAVGSDEAEARACRDIRKHIAWYFKGYAVGHEVRSRLAMLESLAQYDEIVGELDDEQPYPGEIVEGPRGRTRGARGVNLPEGWLDSRDLDDLAAATIREAELAVSGG